MQGAIHLARQQKMHSILFKLQNNLPGVSLPAVSPDRINRLPEKWALEPASCP